MKAVDLAALRAKIVCGTASNGIAEPGLEDNGEGSERLIGA